MSCREAPSAAVLHESRFSNAAGVTSHAVFAIRVGSIDEHRRHGMRDAIAHGHRADDEKQDRSREQAQRRSPASPTNDRLELRRDEQGEQRA